MAVAAPATQQPDAASIRSVTREQWRAFWAVMLGWIVDSFDFNILAFIVIDKITPYDLWGEIVEKHNKALAMVVAAMCLGISIIVAAAIH